MILATGVLTLIVLIAVLVKVSEKKGSADADARISDLQQQCRRMEQNQAAINARIQALDSHSAQLNSLVDARLAAFSETTDRLSKSVDGKLSEIRQTVDE